MARKTLKQKQKTTQKRFSEATPKNLGTNHVKREFEFQFNLDDLSTKKITPEKNHYNSIRLNNLGTQQSDILKTVVLALVIFALEFVIYSKWFN